MPESATPYIIDRRDIAALIAHYRTNHLAALEHAKVATESGQLDAATALVADAEDCWARLQSLMAAEQGEQAS